MSEEEPTPTHVTTTGKEKLAALTGAFQVVAALALVGVLTALMFITVQTNRIAKSARDTAESVTANQAQNRDTFLETKHLAALIEGCVTPGSKCYKKTLAQTAATIGSINEITFLAVACASQLRQPHINEAEANTLTRRCVSNLLKKDR